MILLGGSDCVAYLQKNSNEIITYDNIGYVNSQFIHNDKLATGTYYIRIRTRNSRGTYTVNATKQVDDYPSELNEAKTIGVGKIVIGKIDGYADYDCFKFNTYSYDRFSFRFVNASNDLMKVNIRDNAQGLVYDLTLYGNVSNVKESTLRKNSTYYVTFSGYDRDDYIRNCYFKVTKIIPNYQGKSFLVRNGQVTFNVIGLDKYNDFLHYFTNNAKDTVFNSIVYYGGEPYYVLNGVITLNYTGLGKYNSVWWYVKNSRINKSYSGNYKWKVVTYKIQNGKVISPKVKY